MSWMLTVHGRDEDAPQAAIFRALETLRPHAVSAILDTTTEWVPSDSEPEGPEAPSVKRPIWTDPSGKPDRKMLAIYAEKHGVTMPEFYHLAGEWYVLNDMDAALAELERLGF